jgi:hypothetical protein
MARMKQTKVKYNKNGELIRTPVGPRAKPRKSRTEPVDKTIDCTSSAPVELYEPRVKCRIATESLSYRVMDLVRETRVVSYCNDSVTSDCKYAQKKLARMRQFLKGIQPHPWVEQGATSSAPGDQPWVPISIWIVPLHSYVFVLDIFHIFICTDYYSWVMELHIWILVYNKRHSIILYYF